MRSPERKRSAWERLLWPLIIIVVFTIIRMIQGGGHRVETNVDDELMALSADSYGPVFISLTDIRAVTLADSLGSWSLLDGTGDEKFVLGACHTEAWGDARISAYLSVPAYIVIETDTQTWIYNLSTMRETEKDYEKLLNSINL